MDAEFFGGWNQEEVKDPYIISYANSPIIWVSWLQTEIGLSTKEAKIIDFSQVMRDVLPFVSLMKEIEFVLKLQGDDPTVLCSLYQKPVTPVTFYEDNQGAIAITV